MPNTSSKSWIIRDNLTEIKNYCPCKSVQVVKESGKIGLWGTAALANQNPILLCI